ncbi:uncharacterized protein LOC125494813 [Beta vulgaris subsp. vulgaris]|uniref:uncharacterized protein LOC125494813 n=1 Tax=Beta vulgaris subsp. vulgaris TaxID=3555 RepID=UPI002547453D|nr:uncharacterized protein LOC125494813 [Beta vulgaris subsp. vulgaris]
MPSWGRQGIVKASNLLNTLSHWKIGNGRSIHVSNPSWMHGATPVFRDNVPLSTARDIRVVDLIHEGQGQWNLRKLFSMFEPSSVRQIRSIELPPAPNICDEQYWPYCKSGNYTTKTGYAILLQQQNETCSMNFPGDRDFFRVLWGSSIMPKWKLFIWKLWHNGLATKQNLFRRQIGSTSDCPICLHDFEDLNHLFRFCPLAIEAWANRDLGMDQEIGANLPMREWLRSWFLFFFKKDGFQGQRLPRFVGTLWSIWLLRNEQVFRQVRPSMASISTSLRKSDDQHDYFAIDRGGQHRVMRDPISPPGFYQVQLGNQSSGGTTIQIQLHAVWNKANLTMGMGWAICTASDHPGRQYGRFSYASSAIAALVMACLRAVH